MNSIKKSFTRVNRSEQGMVAIMTAMILIIVISLIVLGFAQIARRNQRESLDRQLSTQAFYAAETGVNDVRQLIKSSVAAGTTVPTKDGCTDTGPGGFYAALNPVINSGKNVKYTCLLVDATPSTLRYGDVGTTSTIVPLESANGVALSRVSFNWQSKVGTNPIGGCPATSQNVFKLAASWTCGYGVLRFDLVPTAGSSQTAQSLQSNTMTTFVVPLSAGGVASIPFAASTANNNDLIGGRCTNSGCDLDVTGLSQDSYYLRISSLYRNVSLQINAHDASNTVLELKNAQAVVDATGKAQDVLRRIQVNLPILSASQNKTSDYAIQSVDAICKRFSVMDNYFDNSQIGVAGGLSRLCAP